MCSAEQTHEDVHLSLSPTYTEGILKLTPVVKYDGEQPVTFIYEDTIAWVETVKSDGKILYEHKVNEQIPAEIRSFLVKDDKRYGKTIEIEAEPGLYEVQLIAEYWLESEEMNEQEKYYHTLTRKIETKK